MGKGHRARSRARMTHGTCFLGLSHPTAGLGPRNGQTCEARPQETEEETERQRGRR